MPQFRANRRLHRRAEAGQVFTVEDHEAKQPEFQKLESRGIIERVHGSPGSVLPRPQPLDLKALVGYENKAITTTPVKKATK